jgi:hypothetical protein
MKACLDEDGLLQLYLADASEYPDRRSHVAECSSCTGRLHQVARDAGTITGALTHAADHLNYRSSAGANVFARIGDGFRTMVVFSGAAAFGGAAAFAVILALGWRPVVTGDQLARATSGNVVSAIAPAGAVGAASQVIASNNDADSAADNSLPGTGALYSAEAVTGDPLAGLVYDGSTTAGNSDSDDDMLFCVPGDDGSICNSYAGQQG